MKKVIALLLAALMIFALASCQNNNGASQEPASQEAPASTADTSAEPASQAEPTGAGKRVGVAMPTQSSQRWIQDGGNMKEKLEALGYEVDLQYAEDDVQAQVSQIENMITSGANCLVIAAVDSGALVNVLNQAKQNNIPVIAYDRLLMDTDAVSYYATFDNEGLGVIIGNYIIDTMGLANGAGPFNIEIFNGSPDDNNAHMLNNGLMKTIQPYFDSKQLVCQSGQIDFDTNCTLRWSQEEAQKRCENIMSAYYSTGEHLDIVASAFDGLSYGIAAALEGAGYKVGDQWPIISGQDAELMAAKNILSGKQTQTIFKDTRVLAEKCVTMVQAVLEGSEPEINDTTTYNNNVITVPSYLCTPISITKDNLVQVLVDDSGYYTMADLEG